MRKSGSLLGCCPFLVFILAGFVEVASAGGDTAIDSTSFFGVVDITNFSQRGESQ